MGGSGDSPKITEIIFIVKSFPKLVDSLVVKMFHQQYPPKIYFRPPPIGGGRGSGSSLVSPPKSQYIGGPESVKILGVRGKLAV